MTSLKQGAKIFKPGNPEKAVKTVSIPAHLGKLTGLSARPAIFIYLSYNTSFELAWVVLQKNCKLSTTETQDN